MPDEACPRCRRSLPRHESRCSACAGSVPAPLMVRTVGDGALLPPSAVGAPAAWGAPGHDEARVSRPPALPPTAPALPRPPLGRRRSLGVGLGVAGQLLLAAACALSVGWLVLVIVLGRSLGLPQAAGMVLATVLALGFADGAGRLLRARTGPALRAPALASMALALVLVPGLALAGLEPWAVPLGIPLGGGALLTAAALLALRGGAVLEARAA